MHGPLPVFVDEGEDSDEVTSPGNNIFNKEISYTIDSSSEDSQGTSKRRKFTSKVREDFDRLVSPNKKVTAVRKYCNLKVKKASKADVGQMLLNMNTSTNDGNEGLSNFKFDEQVSHQCLARMIVLHEYPFSIVDHVGFREYSNSLNPQFKIVSRATIKETCMKLYETEKAKLYKTLDSVSSNVSITSDLWTSGQGKGYISLSAHYIDNDWQMRKTLLNFSCLPSPHTGGNIAEKIYEKLLEWNIDRKLSSIVLDNCSTNDVVVRELQRKLINRGLLSLDGSLFHVQCCAHILNLIVQDGLSEIEHVIETVRNCIKYIKSSTGRKEKFEEVVSQVRAPQKQLVLDVPTRWDSTYLMLSTALQLKNAFARMGSRDRAFPFTLLDDDWKNLEAVCTCLSLFYGTTLVFSSTSRPTISDLFNHVSTIKINLKKWVTSDILFIASMAGNMLNKFEKYWGATRKLLAIATMLDPRYKMCLLLYCYPQIYGDESDFYVDEAKRTLQALYKEYAIKYQGEASSSRVSMATCDSFSSVLEQSNALACPMVVKAVDGYRQYLKEKTSAHVKSDLETYLDEEVIPVSLHNSFDILHWWKFNRFKYPVVSSMARDILSIPVSTVASEAAFSTSGRESLISIDPL